MDSVRSAYDICLDFDLFQALKYRIHGFYWTVDNSRKQQKKGDGEGYREKDIW